MSFDGNQFAPISSAASNPPKVYSYRSDDNLVAVTAPGYFADKKFQLGENDWILAVLGDGNVLLQVLADTQSVQPVEISGLPIDNFKGGFFDYNDVATQSTPIVVTGGGGFVKLTNDEQGAFTNKDYPPAGVTDIWDSINNRFDFSELNLGDMIDLRLDLEVTTTSPNQELDIRLFLGIGQSEYSVPFVKLTYKTAGAQAINRFNGIYIGNLVTLNGFGEFRIASDANATVKVNGWYCKIIRRGG